MYFLVRLRRVNKSKIVSYFSHRGLQGFGEFFCFVLLFSNFFLFYLRTEGCNFLKFSKSKFQITFVLDLLKCFPSTNSVCDILFGLAEILFQNIVEEES